MNTDFLVIGAGVAGLRAAIELAPAGRVTVLAKREAKDPSTQLAKGGSAAVLSDEDEISLHLQDTIDAGDGLVNEQAARVLVEDAPARIEELIAWGTQFDRDGTKLTFVREGGHSHNRILHAHGDSTGREIQRALYAKVKTLPAVSVREFEFSTDLVVRDGRISGVQVLNERGEFRTIHASAVLLATGGMGQVYLDTTNPGVSTGDGVAMAYRAGAKITDLEFFQFHPTALYLKKAPHFPLSEALCGEGAYLRNLEMMRFMPKYHPSGELAPRDVVARAIMHELERSRCKDPVVYLDLTHLEGSRIRRHFPRIYSTCLDQNIDIASEMIPVRPAAHYAMGGVRTDLDGRASLPGLYAAGEAARTGVHGANRLPSNSLLEGLVFGARAGKKMRDELKHPAARSAELPPAAYSNGPVRAPIEGAIREVQELMWKHAGIVRTASGLKAAIHQLETIAERVSHPQSRREFEARNLHIAGLLLARMALAREESRGAHYRTDFPNHNDLRFRKHSVIERDSLQFE
ncbi:MAG TPA: L-aspartate oxidase [Sphingomicrobium sp.]|nr:L-aspartate oxidase [Sphingomicrobium sp.]